MAGYRVFVFFPNRNEQDRIVYLVFIGRVWMSYDYRLTFFMLINFFNVEPLRVVMYVFLFHSLFFVLLQRKSSSRQIRAMNSL